MHRYSLYACAWRTAAGSADIFERRNLTREGRLLTTPRPAWPQRPRPASGLCRFLGPLGAHGVPFAFCMMSSAWEFEPLEADSRRLSPNTCGEVPWVPAVCLCAACDAWLRHDPLIVLKARLRHDARGERGRCSASPFGSMTWPHHVMHGSAPLYVA